MDLINAAQIINRFTDSAVISPEVTYFADTSATFIGSLKTEVSSSVAFYQAIPGFLKILSMFENPDLDIQGTKIKIEEGDSKAYFLSSDASLVRHTIDPKVHLEKSLDSNLVFAIEMEESLIRRIKNANSCIHNSSLVIKSLDSKVYFIIKDIDVLSSESHSLTIEVTDKMEMVGTDFEIGLDASIVSRMPGNFRLEVRQSPRTGSFRTIFQREGLTVVGAANAVEKKL